MDQIEIEHCVQRLKYDNDHLYAILLAKGSPVSRRLRMMDRILTNMGKKSKLIEETLLSTSETPLHTPSTEGKSPSKPNFTKRASEAEKIHGATEPHRN